MSKRGFFVVAGILGLAVLAGCTGPKPMFHECGGNNCRNEGGRDVDLTTVSVTVVETTKIG